MFSIGHWERELLGTNKTVTFRSFEPLKPTNPIIEGKQYISEKLEVTETKVKVETTEEHKNKIIYELWKIIDDIDTASDKAKENDWVYRNYVEKKQKERFDVCSIKFIDALYDKYYDKHYKGGD